MPNIKSAKKRVRVTQIKTLRNKMVKSNLRTTIKSAVNLINSNGQNKEEYVRLAIKKIDQAVSKGVLPKNNASHKKSKLQKMLNGA